jgi:hypothetical protein
MFSTIVLVILFFIALVSIWLLLVGNKVHDKLIKKAEKFTKENLFDKGEDI